MRKLFSFMTLMAMFLPWVAQAQTTPAPASLPYSHGFEDATENTNWTIVHKVCTFPMPQQAIPIRILSAVLPDMCLRIAKFQ